MLARTLSGAVFHLSLGQPAVGIGFSVADSVLLLLGLLFRLMTHVMAEAAALARELAEIV